MDGSRYLVVFWTLTALALAGVAQCRTLARKPRSDGRSLLQLGPDCANLYGQAISVCTDVTQRAPGSICCGAIGAVDTECLAGVLTTLSESGGDTTAANTLNSTLLSCNITLGQGTLDPPPGNSSTVLPEGEVWPSWMLGDSDGVTCNDYAGGGDFSNGVGPNWEAAGTAMPTDAELKAVGDRWCANRTGAVDEWLAAMDAGGRTAQVAMVAMVYYECPADSSELWDWLGDELINDDRLASQQTALRYAQAMVDAADASGVNFCVTLAVENATGGVLLVQAVHVGPGPDSPEGCPLAFQQSLAICGNATSPPTAPCCAALGALVDSCRASLANSTDITVSISYNLFATNCGPVSAPLPDGEVWLHFSTGDSAQCRTYDTSVEDFVPIANSTWGPSADSPPADSVIETFQARMCPLGEDAGPLLVESFAAGGEAARAAAYVVTRRNSCPANGEEGVAIGDAAYSAFINAPELEDTSRVMGLVGSFVEGCDQTGVGACVTVMVVNPTSKAVLFEANVHTGVQTSDPVAQARSAIGASAQRVGKEIRKLSSAAA